MSGSNQDREQEPKPAPPSQGAPRVPPGLTTGLYYRRLRVGLLAAYLVPLLVLSLYFHFQFELEWTPEQIRTELRHIDQAVFRAKAITQKQLGLVRHSEPRRVAVAVNAFLDEVTDGLLEKEFLVSNIKLARDYAPDLPEVMLDPDQIRQVFLNLINNASDAIAGAGTIALKTRREDGSIRVTISDTGRDMTSEQMKKFFLPFCTTKEVGKGTGLGLSISLSIVEAMGGRIEMQSLPGSGSSFAVVLPINPETEAPDERAAGSPSA
jgi:two-component system, NtrC family, sensor kinase